MMQGGLVLAARRVRSKEEKTNKKNEKNPPHRNHTTKPASAQRPQTTSRQLTTKRVPRVSPYSPASIDPGFVEIGLVQLSQPVKTTNVTHTHTHIPTDKLNNGTQYAPRYQEAFCLKAKNVLGRFAL